jgi:hypothetical protein
MTFILRLFALGLTLSLVACSEDLPVERGNGDEPVDAPSDDDDESADTKMDAGRRDGGGLDGAVKPGDGGRAEDAGQADASVGDAQVDANVPQGIDAAVPVRDAASAEDAGEEPEKDAGKDAGTDAGKDAGKDAGTDTAADAGPTECIDVFCLTNLACTLANGQADCGFTQCVNRTCR